MRHAHYLKNREKIRTRSHLYWKSHRAQHNEYARKYYRSNPVYFKVHRIQMKRWWENHPQKRREYAHAHYLKNREKIRTRQRLYRKSHRAQYSALARKYYPLRYRRRPEYFKKRQALRRGRPILFTLNQPFPGAELHHVEENIGVYLPRSVHRSRYHCLETGTGMVEINERVADFMECGSSLQT